MSNQKKQVNIALFYLSNPESREKIDVRVALKFVRNVVNVNQIYNFQPLTKKEAKTNHGEKTQIVEYSYGKNENQEELELVSVLEQKFNEVIQNKDIDGVLILKSHEAISIEKESKYFKLNGPGFSKVFNHPFWSVVQ